MISVPVFGFLVFLFLFLSWATNRVGYGVLYNVQYVRDQLRSQSIPANKDTTTFLKNYRAGLDQIEEFAQKLPKDGWFGAIVVAISVGVYKWLPEAFLVDFIITIGVMLYLVYLCYQATIKVEWMRTQMSFLNAYLMMHAMESVNKQIEEEQASLNLDNPIKVDNTLISMDLDDFSHRE